MDEYFIGLDIGTESVGWAVTKPDYTLAKCNGKALWGVRLFETAETAADRRLYRTARRRLERRHQRLQWLQEIFSGEIGKVDPAFFLRLQESKFLEEDKAGDQLGRYTLFADKTYCDKDYHREFPTIYHLRKALIEGDRAFDSRLVYLALHHIMKYRGHFLFGGLSMDSISLEAGIKRLNIALEQELDSNLPDVDMTQLKEILIDRKCSKTVRKKKLHEIFHVDKKEHELYAVLDLLAGAKVSLDALYGDAVVSDEIQKISIADDFDTIAAPLHAALGDRIELILAVKEIYDWALLENMRAGERYLSFSKVRDYEKHTQDLLRLKKLLKAEGCEDIYREIFHAQKDKLDNYVAYSGKGSVNYRCGYDAFCKYLRKKIGELKETGEEQKKILEELDQGIFLPKQTNKDNGVIPHQLHEDELKTILENASRYLPFLTEKDASGLTKAEQIHAMFCFRVPYYVGPLSVGFDHWVVRKDEKIYPWNFDQVVDVEQCAAKFITRMTAKCSYIGEAVLPKDSLLYTKFMVLNELNNLKINGKEIPVSLKQDIYHEKFLSGKKITQKALRGYLSSKGVLQPEDEISGFDQEIKATLAPWRDFAWLIAREGGYAAAEEIIRHIVLFGEDKKLLKRWIAKEYGDFLSAEEQKKAISKKYSGWGKLSAKFLTEIYHTDSQTGEALTIMEMLWRTNKNLMQLLSRQYTFADAVENYRQEKMQQHGMKLEDYMKDSYASPAIKRSIHQVIQLIREIEKIIKHPPKRIFVEMAREDGTKGKRTVSRKAALMELYQKCGEEENLLFEQLDHASDGDLRRDKLYLYYIQMGKCMYSGEPIDLACIDSDYDIDHIYPQSKVKDDSLDNRVLVKRGINAAKSDTYPLANEVRTKMRSFWTMLKEKGLISKEKFARLIRATPFTLEEQSGFIARQLVETRQSSKIVAELLQRRFGDQTEIVYVKAGNVSSFRQDQRLTESGQQRQAFQCKGQHTAQDPLFVKCREVNDFHHAKDAYLNIVVGNVYHLKFTRSPAHFLRQQDCKYSLNRMFDFDVSRNGEQAWKTGEQGSIETVRRVMRKNNILFTRMAFKRKSGQSGGLFDQKMVSKEIARDPKTLKAAIKSSDPRMVLSKYGGYRGLTCAYFCLVEHTAKRKRVRSMESVFLMYQSLYERDPLTYCQEICHLVEPRILIPHIKINALVSFDGFRMHISGRKDTRIVFKNANQLVLAPEWQQYIKQIAKYLERCKAAKKDLPMTRFDGMTADQNTTLYRLLLEKLGNTRYQICYADAAKTIAQNEERFGQLPVADQGRVLMQVLNLFANNAASADLKLLCGKAEIGILRLSKNLGNYSGHDFKLIHQSVTGVFEQETDLLSEELS